MSRVWFAVALDGDGDLFKVRRVAVDAYGMRITDFLRRACMADAYHVCELAQTAFRTTPYHGNAWCDAHANGIAVQECGLRAEVRHAAGSLTVNGERRFWYRCREHAVVLPASLTAPAVARDAWVREDAR